MVNTNIMTKSKIGIGMKSFMGIRKSPGVFGGCANIAAASAAPDGTSRRLSGGPKTPKLWKFIARRNWKMLSAYLKTDEGRTDATKCGTTFNRNVRGDYALHAVVRCHPPLTSVRLLVRACRPESVALLNGAGQTPLHVAAMCGAAPQVIEFLLKINPRAALMRDIDGRTPLHLLCEHCCYPETCDPGLPQEEGKGLVKGPILEVVRTMCTGPGMLATNMEDDEGTTPLESAIFRGADVKVVRALQKTSSKVWKKQEQEKQKLAMNDSVSTSAKLADLLPHSTSPIDRSRRSDRPSVISTSISSVESSATLASLQPELERVARGSSSVSRGRHGRRNGSMVNFEDSMQNLSLGDEDKLRPNAGNGRVPMPIPPDDSSYRRGRLANGKARTESPGSRACAA